MGHQPTLPRSVQSIPVPPPLRPPSSRPPTGSAGGPADTLRTNVQPLPPPPGDYQGPMHTPAALRDATGSAPAAGHDETNGEADGAAAGGAFPSNGEGDRALVGLPEGGTSLERTRSVAGTAWRTVRRGVDLEAVRYVFSTARATYKKKSEIGRLCKFNVAE